jgi:hypothetical protein
MKLVPCPFCRHSNPVITSNGIGDFFVICSDNVEEGEYPGCGARTSDVRFESEEHAAERLHLFVLGLAIISPYWFKIRSKYYEIYLALIFCILMALVLLPWKV